MSNKFNIFIKKIDNEYMLIINTNNGDKFFQLSTNKNKELFFTMLSYVKPNETIFNNEIINYLINNKYAELKQSELLCKFREDIKLFNYTLILTNSFVIKCL